MSSGLSEVLIPAGTSLALLISLDPLTDGVWEFRLHFQGNAKSSSERLVLNVCLNLLRTWSTLLFVLLARSDSDLDKLEFGVLTLFFRANILLLGLCSLLLSVEKNLFFLSVLSFIFLRPSSVDWLSVELLSLERFAASVVAFLVCTLCNDAVFALCCKGLDRLFCELNASTFGLMLYTRVSVTHVEDKSVALAPCREGEST